MNNKLRNLVLILSLVAVTGILSIALNSTSDRLNTIIKAHHLHATGQISNAPPMVVFTTMALGSFRGILADVLWLRAASLQDSGNYFEMVQLANWITELQPRFSGATAYLAWNMAYNISVTCSLPEDRWRWVMEGIRLIRDKAIDYNPNDPVIYKELGWIFMHKMGNVLDDANKYYKNRLALEVGRIIGDNPDWAKYIKAPKDEAAFKKLHPQTSPFWKALTGAGFANLEALYRQFVADGGKVPEELTRLLAEENLHIDLDHYLRRQWLMREYRLDADLINQINEKYGKLDWRLPESQAVYWATKGLEMTIGHRDLSCERMITQALSNSFQAGRILWLDKENYENIILVPNFNVVDSVEQAYQQAWEQNDHQSSFRSAKINFYKDAITLLYNYGDIKKAKEYYDKLRKEEPGAHRLSLDNFVMKEWAEDVRDASIKQATDQISGLIYQSCLYLALGDDEAAASHERMARFLYATYMKNVEGIEGRVGLPPYGQMKKSIVEFCLKTFPPAVAAVLRDRLSQEMEQDKKLPDQKNQLLPDNKALLSLPAAK